MDFDVIIIGTGSAGYPAGVYASRFGMKNLIIGSMPGGALATSHKVENFPGIISASGKEIMDNLRNHALASGSEIRNDIVEIVEKTEKGFLLKCMSGNNLTAPYVILATGNNYKKLGVPGENVFFGKGVSYCATCDGMFFRDGIVAVIGGGNSAVTEALYLTNICKKVYLIHRNDNFRADVSWMNEIKKAKNLQILPSEEIKEIFGDVLGVKGVKLKSGKSLELDGIFIAIGRVPNTKLVENLNPEKDSEGCLVVDKRQETSIKGLFAAGDITTNSNKVRQSLTSMAEGAIAANSVHEDFLIRK